MLDIPPPGTSVFFLLGWVPHGKNISVKNAVALYYFAKDNRFFNEERKILLLMLIQCLIILGLSQLIINGKSLRNMEAIRYSTQVMPAVKEQVRFKLNTE